MNKRRIVAVTAAAAIFYGGPTLMPFSPLLGHSEAGAVCLTQSGFTFGSAFAAIIPCGPVVVTPSSAPTTHTPTPWGVIGAIAGVVSIMIDAAIVWNTECRELTLNEAMMANALPGVGIAINQSGAPKSACPGPR